MKRSYPVWAVLGIGMFVFGVIMAGAKLSLYLDIASLLVVTFPPSFLTIAVFGISTLGRSFHIAFEGVPASEGEFKLGVKLFASLQRYVLLSGLVAMMIGFIAILGNLGNTPDGATIGLFVSLALITMFYSLILIFAVVVPFRTALEKRLVEAQTSDSAVGTSG